MSEELLSTIKSIAEAQKRSVNYVVVEELERAFRIRKLESAEPGTLNAEQVAILVENALDTALAKLELKTYPKPKPKPKPKTKPKASK
jgi:hypothetical protein